MTVQQTAFESLLQSSLLLVHYDPTKQLILASDALAYGVGVVSSHCQEDGSEQAVVFASRSLSAAEWNYSQLEKEGLAIIFGVKRFHQYLYGSHFIGANLSEPQYSQKWYVRHVHENLLHEYGLPHTGSEWYVRRVHKNLLHESGLPTHW